MKLNLGSGYSSKKGYTSVDKFTLADDYGVQSILIEGVKHGTGSL